MTEMTGPNDGQGHGDGHRLNIAGLFVHFIAGLPGLFFPIIAVTLGTRGGSLGLLIIIPIIIVASGASLFFRWLAWMRFEYFIGAQDIRIESGILNRTARSIPFERIQDVSIEQKPAARIFGLAEVRFETGSGKGEDGKLSYVTVDRAEELRELVRARKSGIFDQSEDMQVEENADATPIFAMDNKRLLILGFYSFSLVVFAVVGGIVQQFDFLLPFDVWDFRGWFGLAQERGANIDNIGFAAQIIGIIIIIPILVIIGFLSGIVRTVLREYGFRLDRNEKGFRRRRGLLTLTDVVMPVHRVQAAIIATGPIRKIRGWHAFKFVSLAGDGGNERRKGESDHVVAPLATMPEISAIARHARIALPTGDLAFTRADFRWWLFHFLILALVIAFAAAMLMLFSSAGILPLSLWGVLPVFGLIIWMEWRHNQYALDAGQLYVRRGWWNQKLTIVGHIRVQSVEIVQGPYARLTGLAKLHFGIAGGAVQIVGIPVGQARMIRDIIAENIVGVDYSAINQSA